MNVRRGVTAAMATILTLTTLAGTGWAGNNLGIWFRQRENAPEILRVQVERTRQEFAFSASGCPMAVVTLETSVTGVRRSASGLRTGNRIIIRYNRRPNPTLLTSSRPVGLPVPKAGTECAAYLTVRKGGGFSPFVEGYEAFLRDGENRLETERSPWWWPVVEHPVFTALVSLLLAGTGWRLVREKSKTRDAENGKR